MKKQSEEEDVTLEPIDDETGEENLQQKIKNLREKLATCSKEKGDFLAGWQRARADYVNLQKEAVVERAKTFEFANLQIIHDIIPVLDSFDIAMRNKEAWESVSENWRVGVEYIANQLKDVLSKNGVSEICPKENDPVNFEEHAVTETTSTDKSELDDRISSLIQKGYKMSNKILRPAKVRAYLFENKKV